MLPEPLKEYAESESLANDGGHRQTLSLPALALEAYLAKAVELFAVRVSAMAGQVGDAFGVFADLAAVLVFIDHAATAGMGTFLRL